MTTIGCIKGTTRSLDYKQVVVKIIRRSLSTDNTTDRLASMFLGGQGKAGTRTLKTFWEPRTAFRRVLGFGLRL